VYEVTPHRQTLESFFFSVTGAKNHDVG
jgi:hypothetical protein